MSEESTGDEKAQDCIAVSSLDGYVITAFDYSG
jgi:hypothetical protein